jgi:hypothetical protein
MAGAKKMDMNVGTLVNRMAKGTISFDLAIQRGDVWDRRRKSELIHSILIDYPINNFYFNEKPSSDGSKGTLEGLEGKQRANALFEFVNGKFRLSQNLQPIFEVVGEAEDEIDISKLRFEDLTEEYQNRIKGYGLSVYVFHDMSFEEQVLFFERTNSGKPLTLAELARIKVLSRPVFKDMSKHSALGFIMTAKAKAKMADEDILESVFMMAYADNPSLVNRDRAKFLRSTEITPEQEQEMLASLDLLQNFFAEVGSDKKTLAKLRRPIHLSSLIYMGIIAARKKMTGETFIKKASAFFSPSDDATTSAAYNTASQSGTSKPEQVQTRLTELNKALK